MCYTLTFMIYDINKSKIKNECKMVGCFGRYCQFIQLGFEAPNKMRFHVFSEILIVRFHFKKGDDSEHPKHPNDFMYFTCCTGIHDVT